MLKSSRMDDVFGALSDPTRRQVLALLRQGSKTAGELAKHFDVTKPTLSHHFSVLRAAGLVRRERRGQQLVYSLDTTLFQDVTSMVIGLFQDVALATEVPNESHH